LHQPQERCEVSKLALSACVDLVVDLGGFEFLAILEIPDFVEQSGFLGGWLGN
jgi:hypothetical protein